MNLHQMTKDSPKAAFADGFVFGAICGIIGAWGATMFMIGLLPK